MKTCSKHGEQSISPFEASLKWQYGHKTSVMLQRQRTEEGLGVQWLQQRVEGGKLIEKASYL